MSEEHAGDVRVILEVQELVCMQEMLRDARVGMSEEHAGEVRVILEMLDFFLCQRSMQEF